MGGLHALRLGRPPHGVEAIQSPRCATGVVPPPHPWMIPNLTPRCPPRCARCPDVQVGLLWVPPRSARCPVASIPRRWIVGSASWRAGVVPQVPIENSRQPATTTVRSYAMGDKVRAKNGRPGIDHAASRQPPRPRQPSPRMSRLAACLGVSCFFLLTRTNTACQHRLEQNTEHAAVARTFHGQRPRADRSQACISFDRSFGGPPDATGGPERHRGDLGPGAEKKDQRAAAKGTGSPHAGSRMA